MRKTYIRNYKGILLAEWVSTDHLSTKEEQLNTARDLGQVIEQVVPRPDMQREKQHKNKGWGQW